jgi:hypothetical protein
MDSYRPRSSMPPWVTQRSPRAAPLAGRHGYYLLPDQAVRGLGAPSSRHHRRARRRQAFATVRPSRIAGSDVAYSPDHQIIAIGTQASTYEDRSSSARRSPRERRMARVHAPPNTGRSWTPRFATERTTGLRATPAIP